MIIDKRFTLCDATAIPTGAASTNYNIGDVVKSAVVRDVGNGQRIVEHRRERGSAAGLAVAAILGEEDVQTNHLKHFVSFENIL